MSLSIFVLMQNVVSEVVSDMQVGWVDVVFLLAILWAMIRGYRAGLSKEMTRLLAVLSSLTITFYLFEPLGMWIKRNSFLSQEVGIPISYLLILIVSLVFFHYLFLLVGQLFKIEFAYILDKIGGLLIGFVRCVFVLGLLAQFLLLFQSQFIQESLKTNSVVGPTLIKVCPVTYQKIAQITHLEPWTVEPDITVQK